MESTFSQEEFDVSFWKERWAKDGGGGNNFDYVAVRQIYLRWDIYSLVGDS